MRWIILPVFMLSCSICMAREYRSIGIDKRVWLSDLIVVVTVESEGREYSFEPGAEQMYAIAVVDDVLKGNAAGKRLSIITSGLTPEFNPRCCEVGEKYLLFLRRGYLVFETDRFGDDVFVARETGKFVSTMDGPYGAFRISDGRVLNWCASEDAGEDLNKVISKIQEVLSRER